MEHSSTVTVILLAPQVTLVVTHGGNRVLAELSKSSSSLGVAGLRVRPRSISLRTLQKHVQVVVLQDTDAGGKTEGRSERIGVNISGGERIPLVSEGKDRAWYEGVGVGVEVRQQRGNRNWRGRG